MARYLIDTDVMVDVSRRVAAAATFVDSLDEITISVITAHGWGREGRWVAKGRARPVVSDQALIARLRFQVSISSSEDPSNASRF